ncbi:MULTISPECIES: trimeric intracellular cation channel family protein [Clostridia]|uniref:Membrane protein n=1 Tax=Lacrimispora celerecrescens TaxID=29354 RepID=A0A084JHI6_9FIRM|nr:MULTISPECIES: trimeric intracellular cation channel family protein [Clostridia]KEZ88420.1 membrane protein [Lacrimispora celerecrescens]MBW4846675.1 trimeric intracellular cation channel family protein [Lachnospiraceae bacterium]MSS10965.1 trimeric intracellular cation channel family protein [Clostridium sp. WB02_MRS01]
MKIEFSLFFFIEVIGTIAFASSGAMVAIKKQLDLLGVIVLGVTTAVGGGMLRDIIIGNVPPALFKDPIYVLLAFITVMLLFVIVRLNQKILDGRSMETYEKVMNIFDAIGLGAFTVVGIDTAVLSGYGDYHFLIIFLGVITGVGGGILRDIMAGQTPYVLRKHIYACASIVGAILYAWLLNYIDGNIAMLIGACSVVLIRLMATHFCWNLPTATKK